MGLLLLPGSTEEDDFGDVVVDVVVIELLGVVVRIAEVEEVVPVRTSIVASAVPLIQPRPAPPISG